ncbi:MAG TPA: HAMP domain-containing sensor histidine kinase, partial [Myxococcota bacterium]|nr:HAMP domain-containing sensor histidine kinase [Myxococcota bacterium]
VEQLLTLARADPDAAVSAPAPVDLAQLARVVVEERRIAAEAKGLALEDRTEPGVEVVGDRVALRALVENLVDNALRYTPAGTVTVRAFRERERAVLEVEDTGPGIPPRERERVFDRFYRGARAAEGGSGLGLAIVRRIAERHAGSVTLLDAPGGGLLVRVELRP